jgi:hypothetical protein
MSSTEIKIEIRPEPWSPSDAHRIAARGRAAIESKPDREWVTFRFGPHFVTVRRCIKEDRDERT